MVVFLVAIIGVLISLCMFPLFPWNLGVAVACLVGCGFWWYDIYNRAQSIYRDWQISKASVNVLKQKRQTILKEILSVIDKFKDWNMEAIEQSSSTTPAVWWLQERYPGKLDTMENSMYYVQVLQQIETQINNQKLTSAKLAGHLRQMKMDQFFGACVPDFVVIEASEDIVTADLIGDRSL